MSLFRYESLLVVLLGSLVAGLGCFWVLASHGIDQQAIRTDDPALIHGVVTGPNGIRVAHLPIYHVRHDSAIHVHATWKQVGVTDCLGEFQIDPIELEAGQYVLGKLVAKIPDVGVDWVSLGSSDRQRPIALMIGHDEKVIQGQIFDEYGVPLANASVTIRSLRKISSDTHSLPDRALHSKLYLKEDVLGSYLTDGEGVFFLRGIGPNRIAELIISAEGHERVTIQVANVVAYEAPRSIPIVQTTEKIYSHDFSIKLTKATSVHGRVIDAHTGLGVQNVQVKAIGNSEEAWSDYDGRFQLKQLSNRSPLRLIAEPPSNSRYFVECRQVANAGEEIVLQLRSGDVVCGRVVHAFNNTPVRAVVTAVPLCPNEAVMEDLGFGNHSELVGVARVETDENGNFVCPLVPGAVAICVRAIEDYLFETAESDPYSFFEKGTYSLATEIHDPALIHVQTTKATNCFVSQSKWNSIYLTRFRMGLRTNPWMIPLQPAPLSPTDAYSNRGWDVFGRIRRLF